MSRKAKTYTLIYWTTASLHCESMLDEESVKAKIATLTSTEQSGAKLFIGDPISFTANTVTIGSGRKPRAKKEPAAAKRKKALPETNGHKNAVTV